jgi:uncharacterized membrane protein (UPF0127 family)
MFFRFDSKNIRIIEMKFIKFVLHLVYIDYAKKKIKNENKKNPKL